MTLPGCLAEVEDPDRGLTITGTVTYRGNPVKMATIHFLPTVAGGLSASGTIADGVIKDVFTRVQGDGIKAGKYRVTIVAYDEEYLKSVAKRDYNGADPEEVNRAFANLEQTIPPRYHNSRASGLVAEFHPGRTDLRIDLVD